MRILYVTWNVLGDPGANAAELFPQYSVRDETVTKVIVADDGKNKHIIQTRQKAVFLRLLRSRYPFVSQARAAVRIARTAKRESIDVIHVFYRLENVPLTILLRLALLMTGARSKVIMDHRSVNLSRGIKAFWKKLANLVMQPFVDVLAGNPWAVETNHWRVWKPKRILDLGYDTLPPDTGQAQIDPQARTVWFIGSLMPRNRKSVFLIAVFDEMARRLGRDSDIVVRVAGPTRPGQKKALKRNPVVTYYGSLPRSRLYELLNQYPGVGVAFMNHEFHEYAPSLKFCEYAIMRFRIVAADTLGLQTQARRMNMPDVIFVRETVTDWADHLIDAARNMHVPQPLWADAALWSYESIYRRQVRALHQELSAERA